MLSGLLALVLGSFISYGAVRVLVSEASTLRQVRALRGRGRTANATIVSLAAFDPECGTRQAVVRFETEPGREVRSTAHLRWKGQPEWVTGAPVRIRYDPQTPTVIATEAGRRQGHAEIRQAVLLGALLVVMVLPTSAYLAYAGLHTLLF